MIQVVILITNEKNYIYQRAYNSINIFSSIYVYSYNSIKLYKSINNLFSYRKKYMKLMYHN